IDFLIFATFLCCLLYPNHNWAQTSPNYSGKDLVATYIQHNHEFYAFPNPATLISLSNMEKMNIRSEKTVQKVNIYENNGEMIREVIYIQSPSIPEWMPSAYKIIISETGAWIFDKEGNRLGFTRNSVSVGDEREQDVKLLEYHLQNFIPLTKTELARLSIPNITINEVDPGIYKIISEDSETTWDTKNLACDAVMSGTIADKSCNFFVWLLGTEERIDLVKDIICEDFAVFAVEQFLDDYTTPITDDYYVGAPVLQSLNNYSHPYLEKVAFYSE